MGWRRLEKLFQGHADQLYATAYSITGDRARAEDAVHDALISVAESGNRPLRLKPYVFRSVYHAALAQARDNAKFELLPSEQLDDSRTSPPDTAMATEISQAIAALPPDKRQVLIMKLYGGMSFREIAATSSESINTVASRYRRALAGLQQEFNDE